MNPTPAKRQDPLVVSDRALADLAGMVERRAPLADFVRAATGAIRRVEYLIAYDITSAGLELHGDVSAAGAGHPQFREYVRLRQKRAEALAKAGAIDRARVVLDALRELDADDPETLGFLARLDKDVWDADREGPDARALLRTAIESYERAYARTRAYWHGINAATLNACADHLERARALASEVKSDCQRRLRPDLSAEERYWLLASLGEAALVLDDADDAGSWYEQAAALATEGRDYSALCSTRRNARLLLRHQGQDLSVASRWLPVPPVIVFSGHLLDRPDRPKPRFPPELTDDVGRMIRQKLAARTDGGRVSFAFTAAGCGADLIFAESVLAAGGEVHVVLPFGRTHFVRTSVAYAGAAWVNRFDRLIDDSGGRVKLTILSPMPSRDPANDFEYGNRVMFGLARAKALELGTDLLGMAVWDGRPGDGPGGTASNVTRWRHAGLPVDVIHLGKLAQSRGLPIDPPTPSPTGDASASPAGGYLQEQPNLAAMLFADAKGFSDLPDDAMDAFVQQYLGLVARVLADDPGRRPAIVNTWGDGLYMVFDRTADAGVTALRLCERIEHAKQTGALTLDIKLRVALHAGPVLRCHNAVTNRADVVGIHVNRAARLEPSTPPGHVYATEPFVALAYAEQAGEFRCDYVGPTRLAKDFGTERAYHVRWLRNRRAGDAPASSK